VAELSEIIRLRDEECLSFTDIALRTGLPSRDAAARAYTRAKGQQTTDEEIPSPTVKPGHQLSTVLDLEPVPFAVSIPRPARVRPGQPTRTVVFTDTHAGFHDQSALDVVYGVIKDVQPHRVIHLGDLVDCYTISKYEKDPNRLTRLQDEIDMARTILHQVAQLAPDAERYLLEGNHEDRLRRLIWDLPGTAKEIARLRSFGDAMTWPKLLDLEGSGFDFLPCAGQSRRSILPMIITKHGNVVRKWSGMSAKGEWERYGQSGISGHVHRLGRFYTSDRNGAHTWTEAGCTCDVKPTYMEDPNWQQGCVVIEHSADGHRFEMHLVYIQDGRAMWRGQDYRAAA
jgi:hypothetical protein